MTNSYLLKNTLNIGIALVWLVNGLYCKLLNFVPRHEAIVIRIMGEDIGPILTRSIGLAEIVMAIWILSKYKSKLNAIVQISIVGIMNIIEFTLASDLLLWGRWNLIFAIGFMFLVYWKEILLKED
jgi:DoxX-like family